MNVEASFTFDQLSESAKDRVRSRNEPDHEWWDGVYEDAVTIGALIGIEIGTHGKRAEIDIWFSGFWSQDNGCCYSGRLHIALLNGGVAKIKEHAPQDEVLHALAAEGETLYARIAARLMEVRMLGGEYDEETQLDAILAIEGHERSYRTAVDPDAYTYSLASELEKLADAYVSAFADWIYEQLETEYEYLTSDEAILAREEMYDELGDEV